MRLFVAAELPPRVASALAGWTPRDEALRRTRADALHLTLAFLGSRSEDDARVAERVLAPLARPVDELALGEALWLPRRRPRVLAVGVEDGQGALRTLQRDVAVALAGAVGFEPNRRPYLPHVTVARVRRGAQAPRLSLGAPPDGRFAATALTLFRSTQGRYETLASLPLT